MGPQSSGWCPYKERKTHKKKKEYHLTMAAGVGMIWHKPRNARISGIHQKLGKGKEGVLP